MKKSLALYFLIPFLLFLFTKPQAVKSVNYVPCTLIPVEDAYVNFLIGPQCALGTLPLAFLDNVSTVASNLAIENHSLNGNAGNGRFPPYFLPQYFDTGTITVASGSTGIVGSGALLQTLWCGAGMVAPIGGSQISIQYIGTDGKTRYTLATSGGGSSCTNENRIDVQSALAPSAGSFFPDCTMTPTACTGLHFRITHDGGSQGLWQYNGAPANYYDNALALFIEWLRTRDTRYFQAFKELAYWWWIAPENDRGTCGLTWSSNGAGCIPARSLSLSGIFLLAHVTNDLSMWTELRAERDRLATFFAFYASVGYIYDERDQSYILKYMAEGAMGDPNATEADNWRTDIVTMYTGQWLPFRGSTGTPTAQHLWQTLYPDPANGGKASFNQASHLSISGTTVTLVGDTWGAGNFTVDNGGGQIELFDVPASVPSATLASDFLICTFVDATHCTADRTYAGPNPTNKGYMMSATAPGFVGAIGFTNQVFMMGIMGGSFEEAAIALTTFNPAVSTAFHGFNDDVTTWLQVYGYFPLRTAFWYLTQSPNCMQPADPTNIYCVGNGGSAFLQSVSASMTLGVETIPTFSRNYLRTHSSTVKTFVDNLLSTWFTVVGPCDESLSQYIVDYNIGTGLPVPEGCGFWVIAAYDGLVGGAAKWYGQGFGVGNDPGWFGVTTFVDTQLRTSRLPAGNTHLRGGNTRFLVEPASPTGFEPIRLRP